jgi:hypothetical protein
MDPGFQQEGNMRRAIFVALSTGAVIASAAAIGIGAAGNEQQSMSRVQYESALSGIESARARIVGVDREVSYVPGRLHAVPGFYHGFYGYWGYGWRTVYDPGYMRSDRIVTIATNVYSVAGDKLVWASQSETFNPTSLRNAVMEVVRVTSKATGEALRSRG